MSKKIMILGGGGSFALNTAAWLINHDPQCVVYGVGRNSLRSDAYTLGLRHHPRFNYKAYHLTYEHDLLMDYIDSVCPDYIVNFAAQGEGAVSWKHSWRFFETNCVGLSRLVEALLSRVYVERFIHIGTSELYGSVDRPVSETAPVQPTSPYAASKLAFDFYLMSMYNSPARFPMTILRPSNAYGPGQLLHRVIPRALWSGLTGRKLPLQGGGAVRKSYIHINDLAKAIQLALATPEAIGQVYNIGPLAAPLTIKEVVQLCASSLGKPLYSIVEVVSGRPQEDACYWLDSRRAHDELGWAPTVNWESGLLSVINWLKDNMTELQHASPDYQFRG